MTIASPETVSANGTQSVTVVTGSITTAGPKLATELTAAGSANVSCFFYGDGGSLGSREASKGEAPKPVCKALVKERFGNVKASIGDLQYSYKPQAANTDAANKAASLLVEGASVWVVERLGKAGDAPLAVGDLVNLWPAVLGPQNDTTTGGGEYDIRTITQSAVVQAGADPIRGVAVAA